MIHFSERTNSSVRIFIGQEDETGYGFFLQYEDVTLIFGQEIGNKVKSTTSDIKLSASAEQIARIKEIGLNPYSS